MNDADNYFVSGACGGSIKGKYYYSADRTNALLCVDLNYFKIKLLDSFIGTNTVVDCCHKSCVVVGDKLIFLPYGSAYINIYDTSNSKQINICIDGTKKEEFRGMVDVAQLSGHIYLFSETAGRCLLIDTLTNRICETSPFNEWCRNIGIAGREGSFLRMVQYREWVYFALKGTNRLLKWNLLEEEGEMFRIDGGEIFGVEGAGDEFYISEAGKNDLKIWSPKEDKVIGVIKGKPKETVNTHRPYNRVITVGNSVLAIKSYVPEILVIKDNEVSYIEYGHLTDGRILKLGYGHYIYKDSLYLFDILSPKVLVLDLKKIEPTLHRLQIVKDKSYVDWLNKVRIKKMKNDVNKTSFTCEKYRDDLGLFIAAVF